MKAHSQKQRCLALRFDFELSAESLPSGSNFFIRLAI